MCGLRHSCGFLIGLGVLALFATWVPGASLAATLDEEVSLDANQSTLGAALKDLTRQTRYRFDLDPKWAQRPVTLQVRNISLQECLQRLLKEFNYAIVLQDDTHIALTIFGEKTAPRSSPNVRAPQPRPVRPAIAPPPPAMMEEPDEPEEPEELEELDELDEPDEPDELVEDEGEPGSDLVDDPQMEDAGENGEDEDQSEPDEEEPVDQESEGQEAGAVPEMEPPESE